MTVLLPLYVNGLGFFDVRAFPLLIALYTLCMAFLLVSTIPTFSGKLLGERIERELVLPILIGVAALVGLLVTYPYGTLTVVTLLYLAVIPLSYRRFGQQKHAWEESHPLAGQSDGATLPVSAPQGETRH
ncbi:MAG: hypothetical protein HC869_26010 [Rhodospirillales bacterium]|nr:hypothetical protein [Rhodospirillales bacterium]